MSDVLDKIRSRGYWDVMVRPASYDEHRIEYPKLEATIRSAEVRLRGWPVPFFDHRDEMIRRENSIGQDTAAAMVGHFEAWRFHTSGQFNQLRAIDADWRHESQVAPSAAPKEQFIEVWEILFYLTEVFELASRLALGAAGDDAMVIGAALRGLNKRGLIVGQSNRAEFFRPQRTSEDELRQEVRVSREDLVARANDFSVDMSVEFFARFGWNPARDQLVDHQRELRKG